MFLTEISSERLQFEIYLYIFQAIKFWLKNPSVCSFETVRTLLIQIYCTEFIHFKIVFIWVRAVVLTCNNWIIGKLTVRKRLAMARSVGIRRNHQGTYGDTEQLKMENLK